MLFQCLIFPSRAIFLYELPSGYVKIAIENSHRHSEVPIEKGDFHSYVSLPEGI